MPTQPKSTQPAFLLAGVLFTVIALIALIALFMLKSKADMTTQEVYPGASAPTISWIYVSDVSGSGDIGPAGIGAGFTTNEGTPKNIYVRGELVDLNGCHNLMQANVTLYRSGLVDAQSCAADTNNCYQATLYPEDFVGCDTPEETTVTFEKSFSLPNYVDPSDAGSPYDAENWVAYVHVSDNSELGNTLTETYEVNSLAAFSVPNAINYNTVSLGSYSDPIQLTFSNTGNRDVDSDVYAVDDMVSNQSGFDNILASAVHYSLTSGFTYGTGDTAVAKSPSTDFALALVQQTEDGVLNIPTTDTYWRLHMPSQGVQGTYTNTLVFTAKAAAAFVPPEALQQVSLTDLSSSGGVYTSYLDNQNSIVYVTGDTSDSIKLINVSDTANPAVISTLSSTLADPVSISVSGDYVFLANNAATNNFQVIDVSNTASPSIVATITAISGGVNKMYANGPYAYLVGGNTFKIVDLTTPTSPSVIGTSAIVFDEPVKDLSWTGIYVYVYSEDATHGYVRAIDTTDPAAPFIPGGSLTTYTGAKILNMNNDHLVVVGNNTDYANTVQVINISNPLSLSVIGSLSINRHIVNSLAGWDNIIYIADNGTDGTDNIGYNLNAVSIDESGSLALVASKRVGEFVFTGSYYDVSANANYAYVGGRTDGYYYILTAPVVAVGPPKDGGDPKK